MATHEVASRDKNSPGAEYADIVRDLADALIFSDIDGIIRIWNRGAEEVFGYPAMEAIGQSLDLIIPESLRAAHWTGYRRAIEHGSTKMGRQSIVTRSLHKTGQKIYVDMSFAVVKNHAGEVVGSVAVARDATQRYLSDKALRAELAALAARQST